MNELTPVYTNKINLIIFSRNRSCQLDLLLRSIDRFATNTFFPTIIYRYNPEFQRGLDKVKTKFHYFRWVEETDFRRQTLQLMNETTALTSCCITDDSVFYEDFKTDDTTIANFLIEAHSFSLVIRNGLNTRMKRHFHPVEHAEPIDVQQIHKVAGTQFLTYNFRQNDWAEDRGRFFSLDGSIHITSQLKDVLEKIKWNNPRELDAINDQRGLIRGMMSIPSKSVVVNIPINLAFAPNQNEADNHSKFIHHSLEELEEKYTNGEVIVMDQSNYNVWTSHMELPYTFMKEEDV